MADTLVNLPGIQPFHVVRFSVNCQYSKVAALTNSNVTRPSIPNTSPYVSPANFLIAHTTHAVQGRIDVQLVRQPSLPLMQLQPAVDSGGCPPHETGLFPVYHIPERIKQVTGHPDFPLVNPPDGLAKQFHQFAPQYDSAHTSRDGP
jgi:hypothetical protein